MTSNVIVALCLVCFALCIALSYVTKLNMGLFCMVCAYLIGCFLMDMSASAVIALFPSKIVFMLFSVCLFYGFAAQNGTIQRLADHVIYIFRNQRRILPFILYLLAFGLSVMGTNPAAVSSCMAPICILISEKTGIHYLIMLILISFGGAAGSMVPWGQGGLISRGILEEAGFADLAATLPLKVCVNLFMTGLIALLIVFIIFKGYKASGFDIQKPTPFNRDQSKTLAILCIVLAVVLIPTILNTLIPGGFMSGFLKKNDIQLLSIVGAVICSLMKLCDQRKVITQSVPWNMIVMVSGVCMLLGVVSQTDFFDSLVKITEHGYSQTIVGILFVLICGFMSFFSGAMSVVVPLMLPIVLEISTAGGYSVVTLASCAIIGAVMTCTSPFSTAGSFILSCIPDQSVQDRMFNKQFLLTCLLFLLPMVLASVGAYSLIA